MSLPILSLIVFAVIFLRSWSPDDATKPISTTLLVYQAATAAVGMRALRGLMADGRFVPSSGGQFSIRTLLILTAVLGFALGAIKIAIDHGAQARSGLAIGFTALTAAGIAAIVFNRFWALQVPGEKLHPPELHQAQPNVAEHDA
jgi:hypothetical protein